MVIVFIFVAAVLMSRTDTAAGPGLEIINSNLATVYRCSLLK